MSLNSFFLEELFDLLDSNSVNYCVLRNYDFLPLDTHGSDIDILVCRDYLELFLSLLQGSIEKYSGYVILSYSLPAFCRVCCVWLQDDVLKGVQFDVHTNEVFRGIPFFDSQLILSRSVVYNGLKVARKNDAMMLAFLKEVLSNGISRKNYLPEAKKVYNSERYFYKDMFEHYFGMKSALEWDLFLMHSDASSSLKNVSKNARVGLLKEALKSRTLETVCSKVKYQFFRWQRLFKPIGFSVALIGTDGSGKSTIIEGIRPPLESALHSKLKYEHMRPNLLPSLARLLGGGAQSAGKPVENPHAAASSGCIGSWLRLIYYSLDYIFGYWFKVFPDMVRKPCLYVFDRYFYDFILDPVRSRVSLPKKLIERFRVIIPEPDLVLCLGADPEIIHERKPELPLTEVTRQVNELREFCDETPGAVWIDTGLSVEESTNQALSAIVKRMAARYD